MITALVVGIVIFAFCLSTLLVSYTLFAQVSRTQIQLGCKNMAQTTSEVLLEELKNDNSELSKQLNDIWSSAYKNDYNDSPKVIKMELTSTDDITEMYDMFVTFKMDSATRGEMIVECYRDVSSFKDVQSYTVRVQYK